MISENPQPPREHGDDASETTNPLHQDLVALEDLVALALGALSEAESSALQARELTADEQAERAAIEHHLALHDAVPTIAARPQTWRALQEQLEHEPLERPALWRRFWMPLAAAALVMLAVFLPPARVAAQRLHGTVARTKTDRGDRFTARTVARIRLDSGTVLTMDADTQFELLSNKRLVLGAGRLHVNAPPHEAGFVVEAGDVIVETLGTVFSVERAPASATGGSATPNRASTIVGVTRGSVRCTAFSTQPDGADKAIVTVAEGQVWSASDGLRQGGANRLWFSRPTLVARIQDVGSNPSNSADMSDAEKFATATITVTNHMPDSITLAPPTGGEPFFFVRLGADSSLPIEPSTNPLLTGPRTLATGESFQITLRLPRSLRDREALLIACPTWGVTTEAKRK